MCRLAYIKRPFNGMQEWLERLELSCGGNGNGIALGKRCLKGVKVTVAETCEVIAGLQPRDRRRRPIPALWHTRRTSSGGDSNLLCHPFKCDSGWLVHNGHWQTGHMEGQKLAAENPMLWPMSDTRFFSIVVQRLGFQKACTELQPPGVWLHMTFSGQLAVWKNCGSLWHCPETGNWGSEPAPDGQWFRVADGFYNRGEEPDLLANTVPSEWWR